MYTFHIESFFGTILNLFVKSLKVILLQSTTVFQLTITKEYKIQFDFNTLWLHFLCITQNVSNSHIFFCFWIKFTNMYYNIIL